MNRLWALAALVILALLISAVSTPVQAGSGNPLDLVIVEFDALGNISNQQVIPVREAAAMESLQALLEVLPHAIRQLPAVTNSTQDPYNAVGSIESPLDIATGWTYGYNVLATAGDVVYGLKPDAAKPTWASWVRYCPGENWFNDPYNGPPKQPYGCFTSVRMATLQGHINGDKRYNLGLVQVNGPIGLIGKLGYDAVGSSGTFSVISYKDDDPTADYRSMRYADDCHRLRATSNELAFDCQAEKGAPLFFEHEDFREVFGIKTYTVGTYPEDPESYSAGLVFSPQIEAVMNRFAQNLRTFLPMVKR